MKYFLQKKPSQKKMKRNLNGPSNDCQHTQIEMILVSVVKLVFDDVQNFPGHDYSDDEKW